jgi:hypothetical protein
VTEIPDLPSDIRIQRYLALAAEARKHAQAPYAGLFTIPPDHGATVIKELAILYAVIGTLLLLLAFLSSVQAVLGDNGPVLRAAS